MSERKKELGKDEILFCALHPYGLNFDGSCLDQPKIEQKKMERRKQNPENRAPLPFPPAGGTEGERLTVNGTALPRTAEQPVELDISPKAIDFERERSRRQRHKALRTAGQIGGGVLLVGGTIAAGLGWADHRDNRRIDGSIFRLRPPDNPDANVPTAETVSVLPEVAAATATGTPTPTETPTLTSTPTQSLGEMEAEGGKPTEEPTPEVTETEIISTATPETVVTATPEVWPTEYPTVEQPPEVIESNPGPLGPIDFLDFPAGSVSTLNHLSSLPEVRVRIISINGNRVVGSLPIEGQGCTTNISSDAVLSDQGWLCSPDGSPIEIEVDGPWRIRDYNSLEGWRDGNPAELAGLASGHTFGFVVERGNLENWIVNGGIISASRVAIYTNDPNS